MDAGTSSIPIEPYSDSTRPSTGSSYYSGITSPSGSSEDEFFDAPESLSSHGQTREDSVSEPRIPTPLVSADILPTLHPDEIPSNFPFIPNLLESEIPPTNNTVLGQFNGFPGANPIPVPLKEEDFSSLESLENASETETVTASFTHRLTSSPNIETYPVMTEERVISGFNGATTNILTFLSPNSDSANKEFAFKPIDQSTNSEFSHDPNLTPPLPESELLDETLQNRPLTPDFPLPPSPIRTDNIPQVQMEQVQPNRQRLYPELDTPSPPPPLGDQKESLSQLPQFPLTPPPPPPAEYFLTPSDRQPVPMPEMEHNPLFVPDGIPSSLKTELLMLGSIPPAAASLVMNPLTQQIILAQQQALSQHFPANIPHIPLTQQIHPNYLTGFQNYSSQHHYNISPEMFGSISDGQYNSDGNDDNCIAEWKRDLMLKEKRILRDKYGDNHVNIVTESYPSKQTSPFQSDPEEIENMFPAPPYPHSPSEFHSIQTNGDSTEDICTVERCEEDQTPSTDRISYPSINSSDEDSVPISINQPIKNEHIIPGFISRMKDKKPPRTKEWVIPPSEAGYISPIPLPPTHYNIQAQTSSIESQEDSPSIQHQTIRYNSTQFVIKDKPIHLIHTEHTRRSDRAILYPPIDSPTSHQLPTLPIIKPPSYDSPPPREIKRPPGDTSSLNSTPSPYKPVKREISYPPGLEPSVSPKKQVIYPPNSCKKICYPPRNETPRPPVSLNKTCIFNSNNDISYSGEREILYPHSWSEAPPLSPSRSPLREIHYPPKSGPVDPEPYENKIEDIPEIPREISTTDGDLTPPIVDSSGEEDDSQVEALPRESTPKKQPLPSQKDDKIDSESENCGFETPTEVD